MNAAQYSDRIRAIIDSEIKENRQVIIVGGTGFYLKALTQPAALAKVAPDEKLRQKLNHLSVDELQQKLKDIDPGRLAAMNRSDVNNPVALFAPSRSLLPLPPLGSLSTVHPRGGSGLHP